MSRDERKGRAEPPTPQIPKQQRILEAATNWCLFLGGASCLVFGGLSAARGETAMAGVAWGAAALLLLGATVDRFESLKGLGIEAKTRQIDDKLAQADDALERIRELAELVGVNLVFLHSKVGRFGGPSTADSYAVAQEVKANLIDLGSSEATIRKALDPWVRVTCRDILSALSRSLAKELLPKVSSLRHQRTVLLAQLNGDDSTAPQLREQLELASDFDRRLREVRTLDLQTLPQGFLNLYDDAPLIDRAKVEELLAEAVAFMPVVLSIRDELTIPDPKRWCAEIEAMLDRATR